MATSTKTEPRAPQRSKAPTKAQLATAKAMDADGKSVLDVAKKLKVTESRALFIVRLTRVKAKDRITGDLTGKQVVALRAEGLAWHTIGVRAGIAFPAPVKALYEAETGEEAAGDAGLPEVAA